MAHKKAGGSSRNGRDSQAKRLGTKVYGGEAIRAGGIAADDPRLLDHLRRTTAAALAINNPQWLAR